MGKVATKRGCPTNALGAVRWGGVGGVESIDNLQTPNGLHALKEGSARNSHPHNSFRRDKFLVFTRQTSEPGNAHPVVSFKHIVFF